MLRLAAGTPVCPPFFPIPSRTLVEFAGAAFSGFAVQPVVLVALYGASKLGVTGDTEQELGNMATEKGDDEGKSKCKDTTQAGDAELSSSSD